MNFNYYSISVKGFFQKKYLIVRNEKPYMTVEKRSFFSFEHVFRDEYGEELFSIRKPFSLFTYKYEIFENGAYLGVIRKENFSTTYILDTIDDYYRAKLNFTGTEYTFYDGEVEIGKGTRKIFSMDRAFQLAIMEGYNDDYILAVLIVTSLVRSSRRRKN
jgi:uncharacterized protein YxjI